MKWSLPILVAAVVAMVACKSSTESSGPPADSFGFHTGDYFEFTQYSLDSLGNVDNTTLTTIHSHVTMTDMAFQGKSNVAMTMDSVWANNLGVLTFSRMDTGYFAVEANGTKLSQFGFFTSILSSYGGGMLTLSGIVPKWNQLCDISAAHAATWVVDTSTTTVTLGTFTLTVRDSVSGTNLGKGKFAVQSDSLGVGLSSMAGAVTSSPLINTPVSISLSALLHPTAVASVVTQKATFTLPILGTVTVPPSVRTLTKIVAAK